jgi:signal transduction histidine kinase/CheY-like chemotaxis protein/HPt (histidine-containing phosphotransfer) domain-containing protein
LRLEGLFGKRIFAAYAGLIGISVLIILTAASADAEQNGTSLPFIFSIIVLAMAFYKVTKQLLRKQGSTRLNGLRSLSFGIFFVACLNDSFVIMGLYESHMMLPIGIVAGLMFFALSVNEKITRAYEERDHLQHHLEEEVINKTHDLTLARDQALEATKAKDTFLANMSHEIRTPLTAIIGFAEYSLERNISNDERLSALRTIVSSGNHLLALINDILDFSKVEANSIEIEPLNINPAVLASEVQSLIMPSANKKDLYVDIEYDFPLPEYIISDPVRVKQILLNVCSNAVKFTEDGGITITLAFDVERNLMCFLVKDTGIGMDSEQMGKIFDPFKQADSSITRRYGGTGLGLSLSRRLAGLLGGSLHVRSEPNVGSEFELTIDAGDIQVVPLVHDCEQLVERTASLTESPQEQKLQGKVLLAEDNENNQQLFYLYLSKMGLEITIAENGEKALAYASEQDFDLIFMDMQMPVMSGVEAVGHLRQQGYDKPIVALTANATKEDRLQCLEAGCDDFVTKPVTRKRFYQTAAGFLKPAPEEIASNGPLISTILEEEPEFAEIIKKFTDSLPEMIQTISNSYHEKDWQMFNKEVHNLKGMGGGFGYPQITELSANMELLLMKGNHLAIEAILNELEILRDRIIAGAENLKQAG